MPRPDSSHDGIARLVEIMVRLRTPDTGCPWDVEQTFQSIAPYTIEEAYEVVDAIERNNMDDLRDELGDLLLQVVFHSRMAEEENLFTINDVAQSISEKMIRRHPHVFSDRHMESAEAQTLAWEDTKAQERAAKALNRGDEEDGILDGVPVTLPALSRALKLQKRAARAGFDWADSGLVLQKLREELDELNDELAKARPVPERLEDEVGDLLFTCVNVARQLGIDPETALRHGNTKFEKRFRRLEHNIRIQGNRVQDSTLETLEDAWQQVKQELA